MLSKLLRSLLLEAAAIGFAATGAAGQTLTLATDAPGSTYNAVGSGMAKVITEGSSLRVIVRPFGGPDAYLDQLNNGEVNLAALSSSTAYVSYHRRQGQTFTSRLSCSSAEFRATTQTRTPRV